jgi:predicted polyphosphate/ATP-dependent NAD kinase
MEAAGASVIVSLGGDGTNRMLAKGARDVPLVPISTGTNNVFPVMVEGTVAGLAAGALAARVVDFRDVAPRCKLVEIEIEENAREIALVDAVVMDPGFVGSRAIWETDHIREIVLTRAEPSAVGMSALGGMLEPVAPSDDFGLHLVLGKGDVEVDAAIAPGLIRTVSLATVERLSLGATLEVRGPALLALDGEREILLPDGRMARLTVARTGPPVVDIVRCLGAAREAGFLRREPGVTRD